MSYCTGNPYREKVTRIYCDDCAEKAIPLPPRRGTDTDGARHHGLKDPDTGAGWYWFPHYGAPCHACGGAA